MEYDHEKHSLLPLENDSYESLPNQQVNQQKFSKRFGLSSSALLLHTFIILTNVTLAAFLVFKIREVQKPFWPGPYLTTPAVEWSKQWVDVSIGKEFTYSGPPSYEIDEAWHKLFENADIRLTADELKKLNRTSVALSDGSGYFANLDVHHALHCLKYLRWYVYPEYYDFRLNKTTTIHADHCIENLRRNLMCTPSMELLTFKWNPARKGPEPQFSYEHTCVNWDKINEWTKPRSFDVLDKSLLVNPVFDSELAKLEGDIEE